MTRLTMPQQLLNRAPIGSLLKRPGVHRTRKQPFRSGSEKDASYLNLIRLLPCLKCGLEPCGEAAHCRLNSAAFGKRQAMGQKPDDRWSTPLCRACHADDSDSQHRVGEEQFWHAVGINPLLVCADLQAAAPDVLAMRAAVFRYVERRGR